MTADKILTRERFWGDFNLVSLRLLRFYIVISFCKELVLSQNGREKEIKKKKKRREQGLPSLPHEYEEHN